MNSLPFECLSEIGNLFLEAPSSSEDFAGDHVICNRDGNMGANANDLPAWDDLTTRPIYVFLPGSKGRPLDYAQNAKAAASMGFLVVAKGRWSMVSYARDDEVHGGSEATRFPDLSSLQLL